MGEQLSGRELDAAVARAMGWTEIREGRGSLYGNHPKLGRCRVPRYTDGESQSHVINWLRQWGHLEVRWTYGENPCADLAGFKLKKGARLLSFGITLDIVLCRSVLAVAQSNQATGAAGEGGDGNT